MTEGHILIVDDDPLIRQALNRLLTRQGYQVSAAASVGEARPLLAQGSFDLVLTDLQMPGEDGLTLVREIRQRSANLPVVMLTAHGTMNTVLQALRAGANDFLTKPYAMDELLGIIRREVRRYRQTLPPGFATQAGLQLDAATVEAIERHIAALRADVNARAVLVIEGNGAVIAAKGAIEDLNVAALGALVAGDFAATAGIASILGEESAFRLNYHEGARYNIYSGLVVPGVFLLIVFTQDIKLGVVMYYAKETLQALQTLLAQVEKGSRLPAPHAVAAPAPAPAAGAAPPPVSASPLTAEGKTTPPASQPPVEEAPAPVSEEPTSEAPLFSLDDALKEGLIDPEIMQALESHFGSLWKEE